MSRGIQIIGRGLEAKISVGPSITSMDILNPKATMSLNISVSEKVIPLQTGRIVTFNHSASKTTIPTYEFSMARYDTIRTTIQKVDFQSNLQ